MKPTVRILAPVWGARYIDMFLNIGVPSMLAPRNLPRLAAEYSCEFVFLTKAADMAQVRQHPSFGTLAGICPCSFTAIDDVILPGLEGYSLTQAFTRGIQETGAKMVDTYFIFMNADFVVSDGAFETLLIHIRKGDRAIVAPSLRSIAENTLPLLNARRQSETSALIAPARTLAAIALEHLHPTAAANVMGANYHHNAAANQLFWWVDERTLVGHFFLMFMFCIRPERELRDISGFCDYVFIPELCPNSEVQILDDSDKCFLLELQARDQEIHHLKFGVASVDGIAHHLSTWTTAHHRLYSRRPVFIHASDLPPSTDRVAHEAAAFMEQIHQRLDRKAQPVRNHPYWIGARGSAERLQALRAEWSQRNENDTNEAARAQGRSLERWMRRLFRLLVGRPPHVNRWHYDWLDYRHVMPSVDRAIREDSCRILYVAGGVNPFDHVFATAKTRCRRIDVDELLSEGRPAQGDLPADTFDFCFIYLTNKHILQTARAVHAVARLTRDRAPILVMLHDVSFEVLTSQFSYNLLRYARQVLPLGRQLRSIRVSGGHMKAIVRDIIIKRADRIAHFGILRSMGSAAALIVLFGVMFAINMRGARSTRDRLDTLQCSSLVLDFEASAS